MFWGGAEDFSAQPTSTSLVKWPNISPPPQAHILIYIYLSPSLPFFSLFASNYFLVWTQTFQHLHVQVALCWKDNRKKKYIRILLSYFNCQFIKDGNCRNVWGMQCWIANMARRKTWKDKMKVNLLFNEERKKFT